MQFSAVSPYNAASRVKLPEKIVVYDSTLRDGEQMPGVHFTTEQKLVIAQKLADIGVHQIEAGFPAVSDQEREAVKAVVGLGLESDILCLARTAQSDIDAAADCDVDMVLLFVATSDLHLRYKLKMTRDEVLRRAVTSIEYAHARGLKVSLSTEDSTRSDALFLKEVYRACEEAGASRLGITDTLGCAGPEAISFLVRRMRENTDLPLSAHLHNDFGFGLANSIAALDAGAEAIATTVCGIGERAGNVSLEQLVMALKHIYKRDIGIRTDSLTDLAKTVCEAANLPLPANQPWIGQNAFSHESGIHVAAVLNSPMTYECVNPEEVGNRRRLVLGKHTGTALVKAMLGERSIDASPEQISDIVRAIKKAGEEHGRVSEDEFWEMVDAVMARDEKNPDCS
ncbi:MAG: homoaconitate hydratase [Candidatus Thermoplasmatota archaeon]|nr:homoaconitate hydratase [Candidatus Thermoplasmatota archaeon]